ncbi:hypothetical protein [Neobacillus bataviensis]|nr:hypothetical protein [Neobacillus bataviensis]
MDQRYNTDDDASVELKKALQHSKPRSNILMSEAEIRMKNQGKKK